MKTTIDMAREANLLFPGVDVVDGSIDQLKRFEALVRADEREACAKVADEWSKRRDDVGGHISRNIRARGNT
jgi:hypothetical protein